MCQGNGEVTAAHPFCVILQKDRLYFKGTDRAVFLDKRGLVRKEKYELPPEAIREILFLVCMRLSVVEMGLKSNTWIL